MIDAPVIGRLARGVVALLALSLLGVAGIRLHHAASYYGATFIGESGAEVRYLYGAAPEGERTPVARYRTAGTITAFRFDRAGDIAAIGCELAEPGGACPDLLGIAIGSGEDQVWDVLGPPATLDYPTDAKLMSYPGLGARFLLRRGAVVAIEHRRADALGWLSGLFWLLAP